MNRATRGTNGKREGGWDEGNTGEEGGMEGIQEELMEKIKGLNGTK